MVYIYIWIKFIYPSKKIMVSKPLFRCRSSMSPGVSGPDLCELRSEALQALPFEASMAKGRYDDIIVIWCMCICLCIYIYMYIYICKYVRMYVHMYVCMYVCMYVSMYVYVCRYISDLYIRKCMCLCLYTCESCELTNHIFFVFVLSLSYLTDSNCS